MGYETPPVWDDGAWTPRPPAEGDLETVNCVIGLGGSGLTLIDELLARGETVLGLDAGAVGGGAAGRNGGFLLAGTYDFYHDAVRRFGGARAATIYSATLDEMQRVAAAAPGTVRWVGSKRLAATEAEIRDCRAHFDALRADGWPAEWYDAEDGIGLFLPTDGAFQPLRRCRLLATQVASRGAILHERSPVVAIETEGPAAPGFRVRVRTPQATILALRVFVAVDGRLEQLLPELVGRVRTARLQMLATSPTREVDIPCPVYYRDGFEYWQQLPDGTVTFGGFRDQGGEGEWTVETTPGGVVQERLEQFLRTRLAINAPITHRWGASAAFTTTGLPVIEEVRRGVWALGGYSGTGNLMGALAARAVVPAALDNDFGEVHALVGETAGRRAR